MSDRRAQLIAPSLVIAALAVMSFVYLMDRSLYTLVMAHWGDYPAGPPFVDLQSVLNQLECNRAGIAVIDAARAADRCGVYNYSPLLLSLPVRIDPGAGTAVGVALCVLFALSLAVLPVRAVARDIIVMAFAVLSGAVVWALGSANVDLIIFELALAVSALMCLKGKARLAAYAVALAGGLIKYYPVMLMGHVLGESRRVFLLVLASTAVATGLFIAAFHDQLAASIALLPAGSVLRGRWGAQILPLGMEWLAGGDAADGAARPKVPAASLAFLFLVAAVAVLWQARRPPIAKALSSLQPWPRSLLISGALVVLGCFAAWQNLPFRGIFLLLVLPGLLMLDRSGPLRAMPLLVLFLLWQGPLSQAVLHLMILASLPDAVTVAVQLGIWMATQAIWWWVVVILGAILYAGLGIPFLSGFRGRNAKGA